MASNWTNAKIEQELKKILNISSGNEQTPSAKENQLLDDEKPSPIEMGPSNGEFDNIIATYPVERRIIFGGAAQEVNISSHPSIDENHIDLSSPPANQNQVMEVQDPQRQNNKDGENAEFKKTLPVTPNSTKTPKGKTKRKKKKSSSRTNASLCVEAQISDLNNFPPLPANNGDSEIARMATERNLNAEAINPTMANVVLSNDKTLAMSALLRERKQTTTGEASLPCPQQRVTEMLNKEAHSNFDGVEANARYVQPVKKIPKAPHSAAKELEKYKLSYLDQSQKREIPDEVFAILKEQQILPLKKKSLSHPRAQYFCHMCEYHCDNLVTCRKHIISQRHVRLKKAEELDMTLRQLPEACEAQVDAIDKLLNNVVNDVGLMKKDVQSRAAILEELRNCLGKALPENCILKLYGSSLSGVGLKGCDVNLNLQVPADGNPALALKKAYEAFAKCDTIFSQVVLVWGAKMPVVTFVHVKTGHRCVLGINCEDSCQTSVLIRNYVQFDPRVRLLCTMLRYWAQLCKIDKQLEGSLPPHAFDLMVIYFLQQLQTPVLPVLHEMTEEEGTYMNAQRASQIWKSKNEAPIGFLWVELLRYYSLEFPCLSCIVCIRESVPLTTTKRNWRGRKLAIEDPFITKRNLTRCVSSQKIYDFIISCFKLTFKYFGIPQTLNGPLFNFIERPANLASLLFNLTINKVEELHAEQGKACLLSPSNKGPTSNDVENKGARKYEDLACEEDDVRERRRVDSTRTVDSEDLSRSSDDSDVYEDALEYGSKPAVGDDSSRDKSKNLGEKTEEQRRSAASHKLKMKSSRLPTPDDILEAIKQLGKEDYLYIINWNLVTGGEYPVIECSICQKEGHLKQNCPEDQLPPLQPLPPPHPVFTRIITETCYKIEANFKPRPAELEERQNILRELRNFIRNAGYPDAQLELFGSSCNGFGFRRSDLDICLTFENNKLGTNLNYVEIITDLAEKLKKCKYIFQVIAIPTAKVPIVKFIHRQSKLECDVSLYNTLAQHNTRMLYLYSEIDPRVRILGYTMKYFAKLCDIGDASRGSLSSYAYTLMVIYFLQQREPPVIPVLQELYYDNEPLPKRIVDGWNAWYFDDLQKLIEVWPYMGKNTESVGELWICMLRFYTEVFNFKDFVISIRQRKSLTRFEKLWNSKSVAIEDPFDLSHNLGMGVSRKMNVYIMKAFIKGRTIFGTPLPHLPPGYPCWGDYLFNLKLLTDGPPPNDRCCRACGRIGHLMRDCPRKRGANNQQHREERGKANAAARNKMQGTNDGKLRQNFASPTRNDLQHTSAQATMQNRQQQLWQAQAKERARYEQERFLQGGPMNSHLHKQQMPDVQRHLPPNAGRINAAANCMPRPPFIYPMGIVPIKGFRTPPPPHNDTNTLRMMEQRQINPMVRVSVPPAMGFTNLPPQLRTRTEAFPSHLPR